MNVYIATLYTNKLPVCGSVEKTQVINVVHSYNTIWTHSIAYVSEWLKLLLCKELKNEMEIMNISWINKAVLDALTEHFIWATKSFKISSYINTKIARPTGVEQIKTGSKFERPHVLL